MKRCVPWLAIAVGISLLPLLKAGILGQEKLAMGSPLGCPILKFTGCYCAGCGGTRAFFAFLKGDFGKSWSMNPIFLTGLAGLVLWLALAVCDRLPGGRPAVLEPLRFSVRGCWAVLGLIVLFMILRNLPGPPFTALAPH